MYLTDGTIQRGSPKSASFEQSGLYRKEDCGGDSIYLLDDFRGRDEKEEPRVPAE